MRLLIQRVSSAELKIQGTLKASIQKGILAFIGVGPDDTEEDSHYLAKKLVNLRIFEDENQKMNLSLKQIAGEILIVSQFTLYGSCHQGMRPGFSIAANPELGNQLYQHFIKAVEMEFEKNVQTGVFGADMKVSLVNDGPVTLLIDSKKLF